ncbi:helix-turn-helix domain-containing protein [Streptomyces sp. NPDC051218]|uniref:helix-turn-helix domain-containing protein n=1 Tax=Streptomyces sp. NPDC051218 TaxID=3365645 RepID=UPI0037AA3566
MNSRELEGPHIPAHVWDRAEVQQSLLTRDFGQLCWLIRQLCTLRQEDLAAVTGLSQAYLSMLESGSRRLTHIDKIIRMLEGLQAPRELVGPMLLGKDRSRHHPMLSILSELRPIGGDSSAPPTRDGAARSDSACTAILRAVQ